MTKEYTRKKQMENVGDRHHKQSLPRMAASSYREQETIMFMPVFI